MKKFKVAAALFAAVVLGVGCTAAAACNDGGIAGSGAGGDNGDNGNKIVLTADTDFGALVSEKVNEDGWKKAFESSSYTDCAVLLTAKDRQDEDYCDPAYMKFDDNGGKKLTEFNYKMEFGEDSHIFYEIDGESAYQYMTFDESIDRPAPDGKFCRYDLSGLLSADEAFKEALKNATSYKYICSDFGNFFSKFSYDEQKKSYVFKGRDYCSDKNGDSGCGGFFDGCTHYDMIETNIGLSYYSDVLFYYAEIKIVNGKLAYLNYIQTGAQAKKVVFYDFGKTDIMLPEDFEIRLGESID